MKRTKPLKRKTPLRPTRETKHYVREREERFPGVDIDAIHKKPRGSYGPAELKAAPKREPIRDEAYRRWVASLPCIQCGAEGRSQAAHPNFGKGMSQKTDDTDCFPLCAPTVNWMGCHMAHDLCWGMTREERRQREVDYIITVKAMHEGRILPK